MRIIYEKPALREQQIDPSKSSEPAQPKAIYYMGKMVVYMGLIMMYSFAMLLYRGIYLLYNYGYLNGLISFVKTLANFYDPEATIHPIVGIVLLLGYMLYLLKKNRQFIYGFCEVVFALGNCHIVGTTIREELQKNSNISYVLLISGMTTVYLLVRGLSNMDDAWKKRLLDKKNPNFFHYIIDILTN